MYTVVICESYIVCLVISLHSITLLMIQREWELIALHLTQKLCVQSQMIRIKCMALC